MYEDTIAAVATAHGEAGVAVVRISGPSSRAFLDRIFSFSNSAKLEPRRLAHGLVVDPESAEPVDEALAVSMPAPHSFTGEDVVEIHCHGGLLSPERVLGAALRAGARLAEPGEFSLRAFLNGRLDLAQAESILDIVQARTARAHQLALEGLHGRLSESIRIARRELVRAQAHLEASLDFSEEDLPLQDVAPAIRSVLEQVRLLLSDADQGIVYRQGVRTAIVGRPNVGKSSLLNALLKANRAIVTDVPGTTRDTVEETANLGGVPFWLIDTAGLRESVEAVEQLGVGRSRKALASADLVLLVLDASAALTQEDREVLDQVGDRPTQVALNKADQPLVLNVEELRSLLPEAPYSLVSALTREGVDKLERKLVSSALGGDGPASPAVCNPRHKQALMRAANSLDAALEAHTAGLPSDVQAAEVAAAVAALGEITGENATEDLLSTIFSQFCIGK